MDADDWDAIEDCTNCDGTGLVPIPVDDDDAPGLMDCPVCEGAGNFGPHPTIPGIPSEAPKSPPPGSAG